MQKYHFGLLGGFIFLVSVSLFSPLDNPTFADHTTASVSVPQGTGVQGCEGTNECFIPYIVTVDVGGEVTWSNDDYAAHTVTSGNKVDGPSGLFDSGMFMADTTFSHKFESDGTFDYFCLVHPWMAGQVVVETAEITEETIGLPVFYGELTNVVIDYPTEVIVGEAVTFDASGSFDNNGEIIEYTWYINDSGRSEEINFNYREGKIIKTTFSEPGPRLIEWDFLTDYGKAQDGSFIVIVLPETTKVDATFIIKTDATTYDVGDTITISGSISGDFSKNQVVLRTISPDGGFTDKLISVDSDQKFSFKQNSKNPTPGIYRLQILDQNILMAETNITILESTEPPIECGQGTELVNGICQKISVVLPGTEGPSDPEEPGVDPTLIIIVIVIVIAAVAVGAGLAITKSRKSSKPETVMTSGTTSKGSGNGRECNVCGTIIPEGKNVCPNCGDTYSV